MPALWRCGEQVSVERRTTSGEQGRWVLGERWEASAGLASQSHVEQNKLARSKFPWWRDI